MKEFKEQILTLNLSLSQKQQYLFMACKDESSETIQKFLDVYDEKMDITFDEGELFRVAIAWEYREVLKTLIDYYQKTQLDDLDKESLTYKYARHKLEVIIADALEAHTVSDKVLEVIKDYIPREAVSDTEDDFEDELADLSLQHDQIMHQSEQEYTNIIGNIDK